MGKNQWVTPHKGGWAVVGEGNSRATSVHETQREAISHARENAIKQQAEMIIQGKNGQIREKNSYGRDPFPPKG